MRIRIVDFGLCRSECRTRVPFRFGATTMREATLLLAEVRVIDDSGKDCAGYAADLLVPRWFRKNREQSGEEDARELIHSAEIAGRSFVAASSSAQSPFELWLSVYAGLAKTVGEEPNDQLVQGFGVALIERAMLDAVCRIAGKSFFAALKADLFGFRPQRVHAELSAWDLAKSLPKTALQSIRLRHTIGLADPLRVQEIAPEKRCQDGLPQALEEDIAAYGLQLFKIKIGLGFESDRRRLLDLATFFSQRGESPLWTVDGNEQFEDLGELVELFSSLRAEVEGMRFLAGLLYVEQPLTRAATFDSQRNAFMGELNRTASVIIDEADTSIEAFPRAVDLGYSGVSVKNCKGVFRALINRGICEVSERALFQSAEDLTNLPVLSLQQDLALLSSLGLTHAERNGHHYFAGLGHLPEEEARMALRAHPDLYREQDDMIALRIEKGSVQIGSLDCVGFGYDLPIQAKLRTAIP